MPAAVSELWTVLESDGFLDEHSDSQCVVVVGSICSAIVFSMSFKAQCAAYFGISNYISLNEAVIFHSNIRTHCVSKLEVANSHAFL